MEFTDEKVFNGAKKIKYIFKESRNGSQYLIVVFSGFPKPCNPPLYNYIRTLESFDINKLFILDEYGAESPTPIGCYYLGENRDLSVECSVVSLITYIMNDIKIMPENVITCGSSKGGFAALYFGIKYGLGHVISGGAQILLGNYLLDEISVTKPIAKYIAGGTDESCKQYLNNLIIDVINQKLTVPNLHIHVGKGEMCYLKHVKFLLELLDSKGFEYSADLADYTNHNDLITFFPKYLIDVLDKKCSQIKYA
jgi:hypothetical protein